MPLTPEQVAENAKNGTQGPWVADAVFQENDHLTRIALPSVNGVPAATIAEAHHDWEEDRISWKAAEANAKRIATVPDMEALIASQAAEIERLREQIRADAEALHEAGGWLAEYENTLSRDFHHSTNAYAAAKEARAALQENTND